MSTPKKKELLDSGYKLKKLPDKPMAISEFEDIIAKGAAGERIVFYQPCHPETGVVLSYTKHSGVVVAKCSKCNKEFMHIAVALISV